MTVKLISGLIHVYMTDDSLACDQRPDRSDYVLDGAEEFHAIYAMMDLGQILAFNLGQAVSIGRV